MNNFICDILYENVSNVKIQCFTYKALSANIIRKSQKAVESLDIFIYKALNEACTYDNFIFYKADAFIK